MGQNGAQWGSMARMYTACNRHKVHYTSIFPKGKLYTGIFPLQHTTPPTASKNPLNPPPRPGAFSKGGGIANPRMVSSF